MLFNCTFNYYLDFELILKLNVIAPRKVIPHMGAAHTILEPIADALVLVLKCPSSDLLKTKLKEAFDTQMKLLDANRADIVVDREDRKGSFYFYADSTLESRFQADFKVVSVQDKNNIY